MATAAAQAVAVPAGWLRGRNFDFGFIVGITVVAALSGWAVVRNPNLFVPILLADLWLLGYHHVIATYTRLCFDAESFRTHRFLVLYLPFFVLAAVLLLAFGVGLWSLASLYLYWQWFHYTRQSWGVAQAYRRKAGGLADENGRLSLATFYLLPLWGILHRSHQDPGTFLAIELRVVPVPELAVDVVAWAAIAAVAVWATRRALAWWRGRLPLAHTLYVASHFLIFYVAYIAIEDITHGWLVVNIWHNAQYVLFVWLFNANRFKAGIDPKARFLSYISQERNFWLYFLVCLGLSTVVYATIATFVAALPVLMVIYQTINFHHYTVDALIWKMRRKPMQKTLGLAPSR